MPAGTLPSRAGAAIAVESAGWPKHPRDSAEHTNRVLLIPSGKLGKVQLDAAPRLGDSGEVVADRNRRVGEVHRLILEHGKEAALRAVTRRDVVEAAAAYMSEVDGEISFFYSGWAQAALPHRRLADDAIWQLENDRVTLMVQPGLRPVPGGAPVHVGVPYGSRARLILLYLQTQALRSNSREIELGKSLHAWLRRLDIPVGGKSARDVRDQAERLSRCRMTLQISQGGRTGLVNQHILDTAIFIDEDATRSSQFIETARLSEMFFEQLKKHPVPVEEMAVRKIANNSVALDIYCWLAYRLHFLEAPRLVSWKALHAQFGRGTAKVFHFKPHFRQALELTLAVYPEAQVEIDERGVTLKPSRPPVAPKVVALSGARPAARRTLFD